MSVRAVGPSGTPAFPEPAGGARRARAEAAPAVPLEARAEPAGSDVVSLSSEARALASAMGANPGDVELHLSPAELRKLVQSSEPRTEASRRKADPARGSADAGEGRTVDRFAQFFAGLDVLALGTADQPPVSGQPGQDAAAAQSPER